VEFENVTVNAPALIKTNPDTQELEVRFVSAKNGGGILESWEGVHRSALHTVLAEHHKHKIVLDMTGVVHLEGGIFGALCEHAEGGKLVLRNPSEQIRKMLWFRMFAVFEGEDRYRMLSETTKDPEVTWALLEIEQREESQGQEERQTEYAKLA
jgi:hypothetical protein